MQHPTTIYSTNRITLAMDLIFGLVVLCEEQGWVPFDHLVDEDKKIVRELVDHSPIFPQSFKDIIYKV